MDHAPAQHDALTVRDVAVPMHDDVYTLAVCAHHTLTAQWLVNVTVFGTHGVCKRPLIEI
jgi:hypothetical protein